MGLRERAVRGRTGGWAARSIWPSGRVLWVRMLVFAAVLLAPQTARAQQSAAHHPACDAEPFHTFDFWEGDWDVDSSLRLPDGTWHQTTQSWSAEKRVGGCILVDYAEGDFGPTPMSGIGTRYYVPAQQQWVITWMSTQAPGQVGQWIGDFEDGVGDFLSAGPGPVRTRIRWHDVTDNTVGWEYAVSQDDGESWVSQWTMQFRRKAPGGMR